MSNIRCMRCMNEYDADQFEVCPSCGSTKDVEKKEPYHLDIGFMLQNRYIIGRAIGSGGFGVTYVAWDTVLNKRVAIKEYYPSELATRLQGSTELCSYDGEKTYQFEAGMDSFVNEAMRLAKLNKLPHIVHIQDSFVENCTAYIIMEYVEGETLIEMLKARGPLPYDEVVGYAVQVLTALQKVHDENIIHRDIAPDNIKVDKDGNVTLIDFGSARTATTHNSKSLSILIKPGYSPEEQYRERGVQGPWTDTYALAAVMYHLITGKRPIDSTERCIKDELKSPRELGFDIPEGVENAIMNALNVKAEYRFETAQEFIDALEGFVPRVIPESNVPNERMSKKTKIALIVSAVAVVIAIIAIIITNVSINGNTGKKQSIMPDLIGMSVSDAKSNVESKLHLKWKIIGTEELNGVTDEQGEIVAYQSVDPNADLDGITLIEVKVAKPPVKYGIMPSLTGETKANAIKKLKKAGFKYEFKEKYSEDVKKGLVCDQSEKADKKLEVGTKVTIYISKGEKPTTTQAYSESYTQSNNDYNNDYNNYNNNSYSNNEPDYSYDNGSNSYSNDEFNADASSDGGGDEFNADA